MGAAIAIRRAGGHAGRLALGYLRLDGRARLPHLLPQGFDLGGCLGHPTGENLAARVGDQRIVDRQHAVRMATVRRQHGTPQAHERRARAAEHCERHRRVHAARVGRSNVPHPAHARGQHRVKTRPALADVQQRAARTRRAGLQRCGRRWALVAQLADEVAATPAVAVVSTTAAWRPQLHLVDVLRVDHAAQRARPPLAAVRGDGTATADGVVADRVAQRRPVGATAGLVARGTVHTKK